MTLSIKLNVDFNNIDIKGRVRLNTYGALRDIERLNLKLETGLEVWLDDDDGLAIEGVIEFSEEENIWAARFDWGKLNNIFPKIN